MKNLPVGWFHASILLGTAAIAIWLLHWLGPVLIPIVLAVLLTFLLSPIVTVLERRRVPRALGVSTVVLVAFLLVGGVVALVGKQVHSLIDSFPKYEERIGDRLLALRGSEAGIIERMQELVARLARRLEAAPAAVTTPSAPSSLPQPVRIVGDESYLRWGELWTVLAPIFRPIAIAGVAVVLLVFMLMRREDLRDRLISLLGQRRITMTTRALDDAGDRISRYLLLQLGINAAFGALLSVGLALIGLPYAALFGFIAGALRYIPYVGAWLAALLPLGLSLLIFEGWTEPLLVITLFLILDLAANMFVEPYVYGRGVGVSAAAALVMVAFWTWLWGPVGIILATPLTACLVVIGRHVPALAFFDTLLGDSPALQPPLRLYQRLLARDSDEASEVVEQSPADQSLAETYDQLLVPALIAATRDWQHQELDDADRMFVIDSARRLAEAAAAMHPPPATTIAAIARPKVLLIPAHDDKDLAAAYMLGLSLERMGFAVQSTAVVPLAGELANIVAQADTRLVCIVALPPGGIASTRLFALRIRAHDPECTVVVARGAPLADERARTQLQAAGAAHLGTSLAEAQNLLIGLAPSAHIAGSAASTVAPAQEVKGDGTLRDSHGLSALSSQASS